MVFYVIALVRNLVHVFRLSPLTLALGILVWVPLGVYFRLRYQSVLFLLDGMYSGAFF